jgi:hypothetical protein
MMYEFQNVQDRRMSAQAIPSYAPRNAAAHFNKLECFCFTQYTLEPGEKKQWPVAFVIDPRLSKDVTTITLSLHLLRSRWQDAPTAPVADAAPDRMFMSEGAGSCGVLHSRQGGRLVGFPGHPQEQRDTSRTWGKLNPVRTSSPRPWWASRCSCGSR